jgi:predicted nucleic acid-binding protein
MRAYIDSDILIWHLRGEQQALRFLREITLSREYELWTGAIQRAEAVFFMRPAEECATELFLSQFQTAPVDRRIVDTAGRFFRQWRPSHGIDNDALLAATAMESGGHIFTLNKKHYPMDEVIVKKAW